MPNPYTSQSVGFGQLTDPDQEAIDRQRQMALMLRQQSMEPLNPNQVVAGRVVPLSWTQGLAKLLQGYSARKGDEYAIEQQRALNEQRANERAQALNEFQQAYQGSPERQVQSMAPTVGNNPANPQMQTIPAVQGNPQAAYAALLRSRDPMLAQMGIQGMQAIPQLEQRKQDREEQRQFQREQLQAQLEARKQAQQDSFAQQQNMARLAASLRPGPQPQSPVAVMGPDGRPVYVPPAQAYGKQPFSATQDAKSQALEQQKAQNQISTQQVLDQAAMLYGHPGRAMGTGASSWTSVIPGTESKGFQANLDTFKAQTFIPMVSALKGMGALSDAEGKKLTASVGALDPSMPEKEFADSLKNITKTLYQKGRAAGLNVSLPDFAVDQQQAPAAAQNPAAGGVKFLGFE